MRARLLLLVATAALVLVPASALADGDPASDVLLAKTLYTPVAQKISPPLLQQLQTTITEANEGGFKVRVALILDRTDLGAVPQLFGQPLKYVQLLASELVYGWKGAVIAVQPSGVGVRNVEPLAPAQQLADTIDVAKPASADTLAEAAITAIEKLANEEGAITFSADGKGVSGSSSTFTTTRIAIAAIALLLLLAAALLLLRRRRAASPG